MKTIIFFALTFSWVLKISAGTANRPQQLQRLNQGNMHFADKKYELAEAEFKNVIISDPKNSIGKVTTAKPSKILILYLKCLLIIRGRRSTINQLHNSTWGKPKTQSEQ